MTYLVKFLAGLTLEFIVLYVFFQERKVSKIFTAALAVNTATHLVLTFVVPLAGLNYLLSLILSETAVILVEAWFLTQLFSSTGRKSFAASLTANLASWQFTPFILFLLTQL
ncbi:MAG: hypothetical protein ABEJ93_04940 [Candidatus Nanohalobium sp.]